MSELFPSLPPGVAAILQCLSDAGFEGYLVGGCVRDALRGAKPHDFDIATNATPEEMTAVFQGFRTVPTGLSHGTLTILSHGTPVEVTTYRVDGDYQDGRHPSSVTFTRSLREDTARRDFTVNAMAWSPEQGLQDFWGGKEDLQAGILRAVGDPDTRFCEDALRILRALRFSAVLGFRPDEETQKAVFRNRQLLHRISAERIREEFFKLICGKDAVPILREYLPVVGEFLPELLPMQGFLQHNPWHIYDVWEHTLHVLENVPPLLHLRLAALFHDSGKPAVFFRDEKGIGHFYKHGEESERLVAAALDRLKTDRSTRDRVVKLVEVHDHPVKLEDKSIRRLLAKVSPALFPDLLTLMRADNLAQSTMAEARAAELLTIRRRGEEIAAEKPCLQIVDLQINGAELASMGIPRGPEMGDLLRTLLSRVIDGEVANEKEALAALVREWKEKAHGN